ncbi:ATP-binding cassette domain-containing protein [Coprobacter fastidiosus]|uniref:ATP-binding cassette domain-containing protein n=1 Tax=Coprobacter fastidiosus TaxID=1099853 RepID=UPI001DBC7024|nr:ATP-binding cassette domain-containing protein [Coprobacter fastidiosus]HJF43276.1 ATP-binding cassette domain-containing protein [Coprobacter fastidiosus]
MERIILKQVLPHVFSESGDVLDSKVWKKDVTLERGQVYLIEAASGTGKSSFCSYLYGYRDDYSGQIYFDDQDIRRLSVSRWIDLRRHSLSLLFQELRLFPELTAWENVMIKNNLTGYKNDKEIEAFFEQLGIADKKNSLVGKMSFGQQQRVAFIRALCQPFDFIFLDEPISHLDEENGHILSSILLKEAESRGSGVIVTSIGKHLDIRYDKVLRL